MDRATYCEALSDGQKREQQKINWAVNSVQAPTLVSLDTEPAAEAVQYCGMTSDAM